LGPVVVDMIVQQALSVRPGTAAGHLSESSFLTVWPKGEARPNASSLNFVAGQTIPNIGDGEGGC
jgi:hypothetical protein